MKKSIILIVALCLLASLIYGAVVLTYPSLSPADGATITTRTVNHSFIFQMTNTTATEANVTLYINGAAVSTTKNISNNTQYDVLVNKTNGYYSWYFNLTNKTSGAYYGKTNTRYYTVDEDVPTLSVTPSLPTKYYTSSSATINFTWTPTASGAFIGGSEPIECGLYNRSSSTANYTRYANYNTTNATASSVLINMGAGRHWWYVNCSTTYHPDKNIKVGEVRLFDVDVNYNTLNVAMNLNLTAYNLYVGGCIRYNCSYASGCVTLGTCV